MPRLMMSRPSACMRLAATCSTSRVRTGGGGPPAEMQAVDRDNTEALLALIEEGTAQATGDVGLLDKLAMSFATFTPDFPMIPGTPAPPKQGEWNPYEAGVDVIRGE